MLSKTLLVFALLSGPPLLVVAAPLATVQVRAAGNTEAVTAEGVVEAVRQTVLAAQVSGAIVELRAKVGDTVATGQVLARIDARAAGQTAAASQAQVQAARAGLDVSAKDFNRHKQLFQKGFISQAALDQADAVYKAAEAQVNAQIAQAGANQTQTDFFTLRAPYAGIVSEVLMVQGDMALPGRPILTLYDPTAMRVTATFPQSVKVTAGSAPFIQIELSGSGLAPITPTRATQLPTADPNTHTLQVRLDLPATNRSATPGMFARVSLSIPSTADSGRVIVAKSAIVRRAEMTGVYVVDSTGKATLRQVRLGRASNDVIEILSGLSIGERIATDPQAAATAR